jgi:hypothetical protein
MSSGLSPSRSGILGGYSFVWMKFSGMLFTSEMLLIFPTDHLDSIMQVNRNFFECPSHVIGWIGIKDLPIMRLTDE